MIRRVGNFLIRVLEDPFVESVAVLAAMTMLIISFGTLIGR